MIKVVSVVGARPQFIKAAVLSRALRKEHTEILVHTGQHYDANMSDVFFDELGISAPEYNLGIGSSSHGAQTGAMLAGIEQVLVSERPDWVLVYGDTNSTLAGALAGSKLHILVAHVEAGLRSFNRRMPEEVNRVLTDHISNALFCPSEEAVKNLTNEGITRGVYIVGDVMAEGLAYAVEKARGCSTILARLGLDEKNYLLVTLHRAENTDDPDRMKNILAAFDALEEPLVFPVHPRTQKVLASLGYAPPSHVHLIDPVGYLDMARLEEASRLILTDSGGVQKEAYWLSVPCITLRDETEWVETVQTGWNVLVGADKEKIIQSVCSSLIPAVHPPLYTAESGSSLVIERLNQYDRNT